MIRVLLITSIIALCFLAMACQPRQLIRHDGTAPMDSALYYQQADLSDPFLDTIFQDPDTTISLITTLYPPPPPPDPVSPFKEIEGYRVQIFAGLDSVNAVEAVDQAGTMVPDSIYLLSEKGLFKVQVGDYPYRPQVDTARDLLRTEFPGAWVIKRPIFIRKKTDSDSLVVTQPDTIAAEPKQVSHGIYRIQIAAVGTEEKALETITQLRSETTYISFYEKSGNLYRIFIASYNDEKEARTALEKIRQEGYPDAWLVTQTAE